MDCAEWWDLRGGGSSWEVVDSRNPSEVECWLGLGWWHGAWGMAGEFWQLKGVMWGERKRNWEGLLGCWFKRLGECRILRWEKVWGVHGDEVPSGAPSWQGEVQVPLARPRGWDLYDSPGERSECGGRSLLLMKQGREGRLTKVLLGLEVVVVPATD